MFPSHKSARRTVIRARGAGPCAVISRSSALSGVALVAAVVLLLAGCGEKEQQVLGGGQLPTPTPEPTGTEGPDVTPTPHAGSPTPTDVPDTPTPTPFPIEEAEVGDVVISEIMVDPRSAFDNDGEWFEVTSLVLDRRIDLNGWRLSAPDGSTHTIASEEPLLLEPGSWLMLGRNDVQAINGGIYLDYAYSSISFPNQGVGGVTLTNDNGVIDEVIYDLDDDFPDLEGHALNLDPDRLDPDENDLGSSWCASFTAMTRSTDFATPRQPNAACGPDADGDDYPAELECDDNDASANPGMPEVAGNSSDDDCDGLTDEAPVYPPGALLITEIMYNPGILEDSAGEWVEIINTTDTSISLRDWVIGDADETYPFLEATVVPPDTRILLGLNGNGSTNGGVFVSAEYTGFLLDNADRPGEGFADTLRLMYENLVIDQVRYDVGGQFPTADGETLSLREDAFDPAANDLGSSWCLSYTEYGSGGDMGTPGSVNSSCRADADGDGYNEVLDCDDTNPAVYPDATEVTGNGIDDDCDGSIDEKPPVAGAIIITELMIDPSAVADGDGEYIELYNRSDEAVDINGWTLRDEGLDDHSIESSGPLLVPPKGYLVLGINGDEALNGHVPVDYEYGYDLELDNDGDAVILEDGNVIVDQVLYDEGEGWVIPKGRSLGLDDAQYDAFKNDVPTAWCAAQSSIPPGSGTDKGTPGGANDDCP